MKSITAASLLALATATLTPHPNAQTMEDIKRSSSNPLVMSCRLQSKNNTRDVKYRSSWGSSIIDTTRQSVYTLSLRWNGDDPKELEFECIFIASADKSNFVYDTLTQTVTLESRKTTEIDIRTPAIDENRTVLTALGERSSTGANLKGIVIRAKSGGEIVKVHASDGSWTKLAWNDLFTLTPKK